jgi:hypothetical protein
MNSRALLMMGMIGWLHVGCQHATTVPGQPSDDQPTGGILFRGGSASFNATRVFGPQVNLSRRSDGSWGGSLYDQAIDISVRGNAIAGAYEKLNIEELPNGVIVNGLWHEQMLRFEVTTDQFLARTPRTSLTFQKSGDGVYGPYSDLKLTGEAAQLHPPMPQFALALVATFIAQGGYSAPTRGRY